MRAAETTWRPTARCELIKSKSELNTALHVIRGLVPSVEVALQRDRLVGLDLRALLRQGSLLNGQTLAKTMVPKLRPEESAKGLGSIGRACVLAEIARQPHCDGARMEAGGS